MLFGVATMVSTLGVITETIIELERGEFSRSWRSE
jgi:hypothetical protein